ncbi:MAG TPA: hypothetical protein VGV87_01280 [Blastocatellia bacterium]|nr:hypothetical protein [Blastocatellia bacterium]
MKPHGIVVLLLSIPFLAGPATTWAQSKPEISTNPPPAAMSLPVLREVGKAKASYNERVDKVIVQTSPVQVSGDWRNGIRLRAGYESSGKQIAKPTSITLTFFSSATDRTYADNRAIQIAIDGQSVLSDTGKYDHGNTNGEVFLISVTQIISYDMFVKILAGRKVQMKIGPTEFELKTSDMETLRDLKTLIEQAQ